VAGYMEGAVRTARDAASQALGRGPRDYSEARRSANVLAPSTNSAAAIARE
jgi:hypothetical protein